MDDLSLAVLKEAEKKTYEGFDVYTFQAEGQNRPWLQVAVITKDGDKGLTERLKKALTSSAVIYDVDGCAVPSDHGSEIMARHATAPMMDKLDPYPNFYRVCGLRDEEKATISCFTPGVLEDSIFSSVRAYREHML